MKRPLLGSNIHDNNYKRFIQLLKAERKRLKITQTELARRLVGHGDHTIVSKYETGIRRIDLIEWLNLYEALGLEPVQFLQKLLEKL